MNLRIPAEWEPQEAIWFAWPLNEDTWPGCREQVEQAMAQLIRWVCRHSEVRILCPESAQDHVDRLIGRHDERVFPVRFYDIPTNDAWCRDYGPLFARQDDGELVVVDVEYNAWGGKFSPWDLDNSVPEKIANLLGLDRKILPLICEGGALEFNGSGVLLTTRSVLLNSNRNPEMCAIDVENLLSTVLGVELLIWLETGLIGDDTDGHIDMVTRFVSENQVITCVDPGGPNDEALGRNEQILRSAGLEVIPLPLPDYIPIKNWRQPNLPASYANYLLANGAIIIPAYGQASVDARAFSVLSELFPEREAYQLDCRDIILEGGALHCLSCHQPARTFPR